MIYLALAAKYWLSNKLSKSNVITDGFYDCGSVGGNVASIKPFPSLEQLSTAPVDKKRETLLVNSQTDPALASMVSAIQGLLSGPGRLGLVQLVQHIAQLVASQLGGAVTDASSIGFKMHITGLKLEKESNVISIGELEHGTFYHRSLLFKVLCDRIGLGPVSLVRGEYNRGWNEIEPRKLVVLPAPVSQGGSRSKPRSAKGARSAEAAKTPPVKDDTEFDPRPTGALEAATEELPKIGIVDLMYQPGRILGLGTLEARQYMKSF